MDRGESEKDAISSGDQKQAAPFWEPTVESEPKLQLRAMSASMTCYCWILCWCPWQVLSRGSLETCYVVLSLSALHMYFNFLWLKYYINDVQYFGLCVRVCVHVNASECRGGKREWNPSTLKLQASTKCSSTFHLVVGSKLVFFLMISQEAFFTMESPPRPSLQLHLVTARV